MARSADGAFESFLGNQGSSVRIPFVHGCLLTTHSRARGGLVCNLSVSGVYVTLDEPLPERGDRVHVSVTLPGQQPLLEVDAIVTWQNRRAAAGPDSLPPGVGLRFQTLAPVYQERIQSLVQHHNDQTEKNDLVLPNIPHAGPKRVPFVQRCAFTTKDKTVETTICNLSRLGAYVTTNPVPEMGTPVSLAFLLGDAPIEVQAVVAWANPEERQHFDPLAPGCGVRFVDLSEEADQRIWAAVDGLGPAKK
jgi:uncharacterized protein (TIGR02266 family)